MNHKNNFKMDQRFKKQIDKFITYTDDDLCKIYQQEKYKLAIQNTLKVSSNQFISITALTLSVYSILSHILNTIDVSKFILLIIILILLLLFIQMATSCQIMKSFRVTYAIEYIQKTRKEQKEDAPQT